MASIEMVFNTTHIVGQTTFPALRIVKADESLVKAGVARTPTSEDRAKEAKIKAGKV